MRALQNTSLYAHGHKRDTIMFTITRGGVGFLDLRESNSGGAWRRRIQKPKKHWKLYTFGKYVCVTHGAGVKASVLLIYRDLYTKCRSTNIFLVYQSGLMKAISH